MRTERVIETKKPKPLPWGRAKKLRAATESILISLRGGVDTVTCIRCDESIELFDQDAEDKDRSSQVSAFSRRHYDRHPIMVEPA